MNKNEFLRELENELKGLPKDEIEKSLEFYSEITDDKIEDGMSEEEAVFELGSPKNAAKEIMLNLPLKTLVKSNTKNAKSFVARFKKAGRSKAALALTIFLCVLAVLVYIILWVVICVLFAASVSLIGLGIITAVASGIILTQNPGGGLFILGLGIAAPGVGILMLLGMLKVSKLHVKAAKTFVIKIREHSTKAEGE